MRRNQPLRETQREGGEDRVEQRVVCQRLRFFANDRDGMPHGGMQIDELLESERHGKKPVVAFFFLPQAKELLFGCLPVLHIIRALAGDDVVDVAQRRIGNRPTTQTQRRSERRATHEKDGIAR
jgi:hypothetical protein